MSSPQDILKAWAKRIGVEGLSLKNALRLSEGTCQNLVIVDHEPPDLTASLEYCDLIRDSNTRRGSLALQEIDRLIRKADDTKCLDDFPLFYQNTLLSHDFQLSLAKDNNLRHEAQEMFCQMIKAQNPDIILMVYSQAVGSYHPSVLVVLPSLEDAGSLYTINFDERTMLLVNANLPTKHLRAASFTNPAATNLSSRMVEHCFSLAFKALEGVELSDDSLKKEWDDFLLNTFHIRRRPLHPRSEKWKQDKLGLLRQKFLSETSLKNIESSEVENAPFKTNLPNRTLHTPLIPPELGSSDRVYPLPLRENKEGNINYSMHADRDVNQISNEKPAEFSSLKENFHWHPVCPFVLNSPILIGDYQRCPCHRVPAQAANPHQKRESRFIFPTLTLDEPVHKKISKYKTTRITVAVDWQLREYCSAEFSPNARIHDILVATGNDTDIWCTTCEQYLSWLSRELDSQVFLTAIDDYRRSTSVHESYEIGAFNQIKFEFDKTSSNISAQDCFMITGQIYNIDVVKYVLAWLASVMRLVPDNCLYASSATLENNNISLKPLTILPRNSSNGCWRVLFPRKVISTDYPIPTRASHLKGLEVSWPLMLHLAGIEYPVEECGQLLLAGFRTVLIPTRLSEDENELQWHLEFSVTAEEQPPFDKAREAWRLEDYFAKSIADLQKPARHFIGWCQDSEITLRGGSV